MVEQGKEEQGCDENLVGRTVKKLFTGYGCFTGKVISFNHRNGYYRVKYEDGDREQLELHELKEIITDANTDFPALKTPAGRLRKRLHENHAAEVTGVGEEEKTGSKRGLVRSKKSKSSIKERDTSDIVTRRISEPDLVGTVDADVITQSDSKEIVDQVEESTRSRWSNRCRHLGGANTTEEKGKQGAEQLLLKHDNCASRKRVLEVPISNGKSPVAQSCKRLRGIKTPSTPVRQLSGSGDTEFGTNDENSDKEYEESESSEIEENRNLDTQAQVLEIPPFQSLPAPSTDLSVPTESVADLFEVFTFLRSFSWVLFLSPFLLKDFAACVVSNEANGLIDAVHVRLLRVLQRHLERLARDGSKMATICLRHRDWNFMDSVTWPSYLVAFLLTHGFSKGHGNTLPQLGLGTAEYYRVDATIKLAILSFLCQKALETDEIRAEIATRANLEAEMDLDESKIPTEKANKWANWRSLRDLSVKRSISFDTDPEQANESRTRGGSISSGSQISGNQRVQSSNEGGKRRDSIGATPGRSKEAKDVTSPVRNLEEVQDGCDWNSDECVLCGMEGNLICCDGCPAAYHSRCVGVCKLSLPEGEWYCPECVIEKQNENLKLRKGLRGAQFLGIDPHGRAYTATCGYLLVSETFSQSAAIRNYYYAYADLPSILEFLKSCGPLFGEILNNVHELWRFLGSSLDRTVLVRKNHIFNNDQVPDNSNIPGKEMQELPSFVSSLSREEPSVETIQIETQISDAQASPAVPKEIMKFRLNCHLEVTDPAVVHATANDRDMPKKACCTSRVQFVQKPEQGLIAPEDVGKNGDQLVGGVPFTRLEQVVDRLSAGAVSEFEAATENEFKANISVEWVDNTTKVILNGAIDSVADFSNTVEQVNVGVTADNEGICNAEFGNFDSTLEKSVVTLEHCKNDHEPIKVGHYESFHTEKKMAVTEIQTRDKANDTRHEELEANRLSRSSLKFLQSNNILADPEHALSPPSGSVLQKVRRVRACTQLQEDLRGDERSSKACLYANHYVLGDAAASAAANFITASDGEKLGVELTLAQRKAWAALQVKAFSQEPGTFYWPNTKKKLMETPKERCGWCFACQSLNRKTCFLNKVAKMLSEGAALILGGIRPIKKGHDHLPSVASYMLHMEDSIHGLLIGPWEKAEQRRRWRKRVEQSASIHDIKSSLLEMGCSLRMIALKTDWSNSVEDAPELTPSSVVTASVVGVSVKKGLGGRRGRREVSNIEKQTSVGGSAWGIHWWKGGRVARKFLDWETLPGSTSRRAARQGGLKEIPGLIYSEGLECPRRTRICAWQARVESAHSISQIALQMRCLDAQIRWEDLLMPEGKADADGFGMGSSSPLIKKPNIHAKMLQSGAYMYLVDSEAKHTGATKSVKLKSIKSPSKLHPVWSLTSGSGSKEATEKGDRLWLSEDCVPLYMLKGFEEQLRKLYPGKVSRSGSGRQGKKKTLKLSKRELFRIFLQKHVQLDDNNDLSSWKCTFCKLALGASKLIQCQNCCGKFHKDCVECSSQTEAFICNRCLIPRKSKRGRKPAKKPILPSESTNLSSSKFSLAAMKGKVENIKSMSESINEQGSMNSNFMAVLQVNRKKRSSSLYAHKNGVLWKKVKPEADFLTFSRDKLVLVRQEGIDHLRGPICCLCSQPYDQDLMYIGCEFCKEWFHADGFGVTEENFLLLAGFKCYKCRNKGPPQCPYIGRKDYVHSYSSQISFDYVKPIIGNGRHLLDRIIGCDPCVTANITNSVSEEADQFLVDPSMDFLVSEEDFSTGWAAETQVPLTSMDLIQPQSNVPVPSFDWATLQNELFSPDADASHCNNMQVCHQLDVQSNSYDAVEQEGNQINLQAEGSANPLPQLPCRGPLSFLELLSSEDDMVENVPFPEMDLNLIWMSDTSISRHVSSAVLDCPGNFQPGTFILQDSESMDIPDTSLRRGHVIVQGGLIHDSSLADGEIRS